MPAGILKKLATDSNGISGVVALAFAGPATGCAMAGPATSASATTMQAGTRCMIASLARRSLPLNAAKANGAFQSASAPERRQERSALRRLAPLRAVFTVVDHLADDFGLGQALERIGPLVPVRRRRDALEFVQPIVVAQRHAYGPPGLFVRRRQHQRPRIG